MTQNNDVILARWCPYQRRNCTIDHYVYTFQRFSIFRVSILSPSQLAHDPQNTPEPQTLVTSFMHHASSG